MTLETRLTRVEQLEERLQRLPQHRFCRLVTNDDQEEEARREIVSQGYDPDRDLFLIRLVPFRSRLEANDD